MEKYEEGSAKDNEAIRTFVFSDLPEKEKDKFMEFMINNNVEFVQDNRSNYIATICIRVRTSQLFNKCLALSSNYF